SSSSKTETGEALENDVCFILTSAFLIFTMQTGYGLLESGTVSRKNEVNILLKNAVNIICGSLAFWCYGFAFSSREEDVGRLKWAEVAAAAPTMPPWRPNYYGQQQQSNPDGEYVMGDCIDTINSFFPPSSPQSAIQPGP